MGLALKIMSTGGMWGGSTWEPKVLLNPWNYNKGVAKVQLFQNQERRLFVWLRAGGVLYHIRSPIDLAQKITIYLEHDSVTEPGFESNGVQFPAVMVSLTAVGSEDPNLVKTGQYDGLGF